MRAWFLAFGMFLSAGVTSFFQAIWWKYTSSQLLGLSLLYAFVALICLAIDIVDKYTNKEETK